MKDDLHSLLLQMESDPYAGLADATIRPVVRGLLRNTPDASDAVLSDPALQRVAGLLSDIPGPLPQLERLITHYLSAVRSLAFIRSEDSPPGGWVYSAGGRHGRIRIADGRVSFSALDGGADVLDPDLPLLLSSRALTIAIHVRAQSAARLGALIIDQWRDLAALPSLPSVLADDLTRAFEDFLSRHHHMVVEQALSALLQALDPNVLEALGGAQNSSTRIYNWVMESPDLRLAFISNWPLVAMLLEGSGPLPDDSALSSPVSVLTALSPTLQRVLSGNKGVQVSLETAVAGLRKVSPAGLGVDQTAHPTRFWDLTRPIHQA